MYVNVVHTHVYVHIFGMHTYIYVSPYSGYVKPRGASFPHSYTCMCTIHFDMPTYKRVPNLFDMHTFINVYDMHTYINVYDMHTFINVHDMHTYINVLMYLPPPYSGYVSIIPTFIHMYAYNIFGIHTYINVLMNLPPPYSGYVNIVFDMHTYINVQTSSISRLCETTGRISPCPNSGHTRCTNQTNHTIKSSNCK